MIKGQNIICISTIDWDFIWQGHQEIMAAFAKNANRVLYIENTGVRLPGIRDFSRVRARVRNWLKGVKGIRREMDNLYVFSPLVMPFPYMRLARWVNRHLVMSVLRKWMRAADFADPIIWTFLPTGFTLDLMEDIEHKLVVYYCIADFEKLVPHPERIRKTQARLLDKTDLVFVQGEKLKELCQPHNENVFIFPFGVNTDVFDKQADLAAAADTPELDSMRGPIIGYIGGIHRHIDYKLLRSLAEKNPGWNFILIGPIQCDVSSIEGIKNIFLLNDKRHKDLPAYVNRFNVCLIPYELNEYTKTVYPTKLNEYLALGKPTVSTAMPEVEDFNAKYVGIVYVARTEGEFESAVKDALKGRDPSLESRRISAAHENSWASRIDEMSSLMEQCIEKKKSDSELTWSQTLSGFYRVARRRVLRLAVICLIFYLALFKTPLFWFAASPLVVSQPSQKVDVIVVFGGGVGETGSPGKSTIERARYAVDLYKAGHAAKIIFSSGYIYIYNDADNMRLFAISMGVPDKDIILEQDADSTYENVVFSKRIMDEKGYRSALVVSSPYNMRRAQLVFRKLGGGLRIHYTPVENAQFYDRSSGVKPYQIKAILHEYLGIVYYLFKGYIRL